MNRFRIGAVSYLNSKPLIEGLAGHPSVHLTLDLPSRLADGLVDGLFDVALVPVEAVFRNPELVIVSDACIACRGPVWSVKLCSRVPLAEIQTLALDEGSRTSAVLVQLLLHEAFGPRPRVNTLKIEQDWRQVSSDAVMLIGDRAMGLSETQFPHVWDLGEQWTTTQGLPFVFAVWAAAPRLGYGRLNELLSKVRDDGMLGLNEIIRREAPQYGLSTEQCRAYFKEHLYFRLGTGEWEGLLRFYELAQRHGLVPGGWEMKRYDCQAIEQGA